MDLSSELNKLKIDKSQRRAVGSASGKGGKLVIAVIVVAVLMGVVFAGWRGFDSAVQVDIVRPRLEAGSNAAVLVATGYVIAHHKIQVGSKITGRVAWIGVEKGDRVRRNQMVVRLEDHEYRAQFEQARAASEAAKARLNELERGSRSEEIERARADLDRAEAQLRTEEAQLKRIEGLVQQGVLPAQNLDDARGRYDAAAAAVGSLHKTYELIRQGPRSEQVEYARSEVARSRAAVDYARTILDATEIRAPIDGTILERNVEQGEMVTTSFVGDRGAKSFVVTLADLSDIQVELDINQNDFNRIQPNQACTVVTDAYPDRVYNCRVDEIAPEANRQKATVQVKVKFLEPDEYIRPEMNARVTFLDPATTGTSLPDSKLFVIPKRAILERNGEKGVLLRVDEKVQFRSVHPEREVGTEVYVSAGLSGKEDIIVSEQLENLKTGDRVEPRQ